MKPLGSFKAITDESTISIIVASRSARWGWLCGLVIRPVGRRVGIGLGNNLNFNTQISYFSRNSRNAFKARSGSAELHGMLHAHASLHPDAAKAKTGGTYRIDAIYIHE